MATNAPTPRVVPRRSCGGRIIDHFVYVEGIDTVEDGLERAALLGRVARLMQKGINQPETEEEDDQDLRHVGERALLGACDRAP